MFLQCLANSYFQVVDNGVTTEKEWDFYVQPHKALQGTARPIHYIVLYDEKAFKAEDLEKIVSLPNGFLLGNMD